LFFIFIFTIGKSEIMWWLFIFEQMFHWKVVFIGWCNARFYNIKNYGQQKKSCFQHWKCINYAIFQLSFCVELHDPHDEQNTKWLNFNKCSPINLIFSLFNFLAKNKLLPVNRKYLLINQTYMKRLENYIM
jgi:hypothetical protein